MRGTDEEADDPDGSVERVRPVGGPTPHGNLSRYRGTPKDALPVRQRLAPSNVR